MTKSRNCRSDFQAERIEKAGRTDCGEGIHGKCKRVDDRRQRCIPARIRQLYHQA
jgi:hypothetical protein